MIKAKATIGLTIVMLLLAGTLAGAPDVVPASMHGTSVSAKSLGAYSSDPYMKEFIIVGDKVSPTNTELWLYYFDFYAHCYIKKTPAVGNIPDIGAGADLEIFDADNDGDLDFIAIIGKATGSPEIRLYINNGFETFTWLTIGNTMMPTGAVWGSDVGISSGDFDNDGDTDFVAYSACGSPLTATSIYVFINNGGYAFVQTGPILANWADHAIGIDAGDFNEDGNLDFVMFDYPSGGDFSDDVMIYFGNGLGGFNQAASPAFLTPHAVCEVTVQDFNNDGHFDILIGKDDDGDPGQTWLYLGNGAGGFSGPTQAFDLDVVHETGSNYLEGTGGMDSYDARKEGDMDVIACAAGLGELHYLHGDGTGGFIDEVIDNTLTHPTLVAVPPWGIGYLIIAAGALYTNDPLQVCINYGCNEVFKIFREKGFFTGRIAYMNQPGYENQDLDGDGHSDIGLTSTWDRLKWAIEDWARERVRPTEPLFLYLFDHGGLDLFYIRPGGGPPTVSSADLDSWLDSLEASLAPMHLPICVIYAACLSGSFISNSPDSISDGHPATVLGGQWYGRVVVCSSRSSQSSWVWNNWELFSFFFWHYIQMGFSVTQSFNFAYLSMMGTGFPQDPTLDDDGDAVERPTLQSLLPESVDGYVSFKVKVGRCGWIYPYISCVIAKQYFTWPPPETVTLWSKVENKTPLVHVRAWMKPPDWTPPSPNITLQNPGLKYFEMADTDHDGNWTINIPAVNFTDHATGPSEFKFIVTAEEANGITAIPRITGVRFTEAGIIPIDKTPPTVYVGCPIEGRTVGRMIQINGTATDDVCLQKVELYVEGNLTEVVDLPLASNSFFELNLNTTTISNGPATILLRAYDTSGNSGTQILALRVINPTHDIAVTDIKPKSVVRQGYSAPINVTVSNEGVYPETFNVTVYANTTIIATSTNITLTPLSTTNLSFLWNTIGVAKGNYTLSAVASPVTGEVDTADNTYTDSAVMVVYPGDTNLDGIVNILDVAAISAHWYPSPPIGPLGYDPNFDLNSDGRINVVDLAIVSAYWTGPPKGPLDP